MTYDPRGEVAGRGRGMAELKSAAELLRAIDNSMSEDEAEGHVEADRRQVRLALLDEIWVTGNDAPIGLQDTARAQRILEIADELRAEIEAEGKVVSDE